LEPWRAKAFPVLKDLIVDRSAFDRIVQAGGFISARIGSARDANDILISKDAADRAMDFAECIGCGACVAACPNSAACSSSGRSPPQPAAPGPGGATSARRRWSTPWRRSGSHEPRRVPRGVSEGHLELIAYMNRDRQGSAQELQAQPGLTNVCGRWGSELAVG
jgi:ferredoxin